MAPQKLRTPPGQRRQRGVYAIEFALVFLIFFTLLYGIICYGILFTFRYGLQNAAEDAARAALRYQTDLPARAAMAKTVAIVQTGDWLPVTPVIDARVCQVDGDNCLTPDCGPAWNQRCQVVVTITASGMNSLLPMITFAMPDQLTGRASMLLDGRLL